MCLLGRKDGGCEKQVESEIRRPQSRGRLDLPGVGKLGVWVELGLGLKEVSMFNSKRENRD